MPKTKSNKPKEKPALESLIRWLGLSQRRFAIAIDVAESTIYRWKTGSQEPNFTIPQMKRLDRMLRENGLHISDLPDNLSEPFEFPPKQPPAHSPEPQQKSTPPGVPDLEFLAE